jgi:hypothetical protein
MLPVLGVIRARCGYDWAANKDVRRTQGTDVIANLVLSLGVVRNRHENNEDTKKDIGQFFVLSCLRGQVD